MTDVPDGTNIEPCKWCAHSKAHGWWGEKGGTFTHCKKCHASWTGYATSHCTVCHRTFSKPGNFDLHRKDGQCLDPSTIKGAPMHTVPHPEYGTPIWKQDGKRKDLA